VPWITIVVSWALAALEMADSWKLWPVTIDAGLSMIQVSPALAMQSGWVAVAVKWCLVIFCLTGAGNGPLPMRHSTLTKDSETV
jgi:hypothetical protein